MTKYYESPIPYMGCKYKLLKHIIPLFPERCERFYDLFGGSGVVCMNYKGEKETIYNDYNYNIVNLLKMFKGHDVEELDKYFMERIKQFDIRCLHKETYREHMDLQKGYYDLRNEYNKGSRDIRDLYLLICYSMNHLIRFNAKGEFNASCGISQRYIKERIENGHKLLQDVDIRNTNSFDIDYNEIGMNDFVYMDIPYSNSLAVYNEKRALGNWNIDSDYKIFRILEELDKRNIKWALSNVFVNRGKTNEHLIEWCNTNGWVVHHLSINYNPFSRGNSNNDEVLICNYER